MKILHFSDTHLWIWIENTSREEDFYLNFQKVIQDIIGLKPDVVVHSGDLFHTAKPSNKAISVVVSWFLEISKICPLVLIAWNHDTPRLSTTTHSFEIFRDIENIHVFYEPKIQNILINNINFVCLPHIHDEKVFLEELNKTQDFINKDTKNVFVSHFWLSSKEYDEYTDEISWVNISMSILWDLQNFDYVALGHYHKHFILKNMSYSWSIENTSFNWKNNNIWYNLVDFTNPKIQIEHIKLPSRKMLDLWNIDCLWVEEMPELLEILDKNIDKENIKNAIVKIFFINIETKLMMNFDDNLIWKYFSDTFYFEYKKIKYQKENAYISLSDNTKDFMTESFWDYFEKYILENNLKVDDKIKDEIMLKIKGI